MTEETNETTQEENKDNNTSTVDETAAQVATLKARAEELGIELTKGDNIETVTAKITAKEAELEQAEKEAEQLENLTLEAQSLSIEVPEGSTAATLSALIQAVQANSDTGRTKTDEELQADEDEADAGVKKGFREAAGKKTDKEQKAAMVKHAQKLTRVTIVCNDPKLNNRSSIQRSVGNSFTSINKMIALDVPTHVPNMILAHMEAETFVAFTKKTVKGQEVSVSRMRPTFNIKYEKALTVDQLNKIATKQRAEGIME